MNEVNLSIYNLLGQKVRTLVNQRQNVGFYQIEFNASGLSSGVYFYELKVNGYRKVCKMMLME